MDQEKENHTIEVPGSGPGSETNVMQASSETRDAHIRTDAVGEEDVGSAGEENKEERSGVGTIKGFIFGGKKEDKKMEEDQVVVSDQEKVSDHHVFPNVPSVPSVHVPNFADIHLGGGELSREAAELEAEEIREDSEYGGEIELVKHLPTLPQLFVLLALTEFLINFFRFIAICTEQWGVGFLAASEDWFQITSWIVFLLMNMLCFIYMFFVKRCARAAGASTLLFFLTFVSLFEAPLTTSSSSRAFQATFTFFRGFLIVLITGMYALAYRQEIVPPRDHLPPVVRNFVVKNRMDVP